MNRLIDLLKAVLLFHSPSPWTDSKEQHWRQLTRLSQDHGVTTKALCDQIRVALAEVEASGFFCDDCGERMPRHTLYCASRDQP